MLKPVLILSSLLLALACRNATENGNAAAGNLAGTDTAAKAVKQHVDLDSQYTREVLLYRAQVDNNLGSYRKEKKQLEAPSEGGEAMLYLSGKDTVRIDATYYGEMGKSEYVFYVRDARPVLCINTVTSYAEPISASAETKVKSVVVDSIVSRDNQVVNWIQNNKTLTTGYVEKSKEMNEVFTGVITGLLPQ